MYNLAPLLISLNLTTPSLHFSSALPDNLTILIYPSSSRLPFITSPVYQFLTIGMNYNKPTPASNYIARWQLLSAQDLLCLMRGQKLLRRAIVDGLDLNMFPECCLRPSCNVAGFSKMIVDTPWHSSDVLRITRFYIDNLSNSKEVCSACSLEIINHLKGFRQGLWKQLPNFSLYL